MNLHSKLSTHSSEQGDRKISSSCLDKLNGSGMLKFSFKLRLLHMSQTPSQFSSIAGEYCNLKSRNSSGGRVSMTGSTFSKDKSWRALQHDKSKVGSACTSGRPGPLQIPRYCSTGSWMLEHTLGHRGVFTTRRLRWARGGKPYLAEAGPARFTPLKYSCSASEALLTISATHLCASLLPRWETSRTAQLQRAHVHIFRKKCFQYPKPNES